MTTTNERTLEALTNEIIADLSAKYDLVYVAHDDQYNREQIAAIVRGDYDKLWSTTEEFESDQRWESAKEIIRDEALMVLDRWRIEDDEDYDHLIGELEYGDEWELIRAEIEARDEGTWPMQLADNSGRVMLRIGIDALDEDHAYFHEQVEAADVLTRLGVEANEHNMATVQEALDNSSPEFSLLMGYWVIAADVRDLFHLTSDGNVDIELVNPHLYLGSPFAGSGLVTEEALRATVRVKRSDLRTDHDAFGHSLDSIYGGLYEANFEGEVRVAK